MLNPVWLYRLTDFLNAKHLPLFRHVIDYLIRRVLFSCWIPHTATIGRRVVLGYGGLGIVIHGDAHIGDNVHIDQCVTIGGNATKLGVPTIGSMVYIGAGAKILGPIAVGSNTVIGANAVVVTDIPANCLAVGIPARVVRHDIDPTSFLYHLSRAGRGSA